MKIAYVTMLFPAASETFASNDVRTLLRFGADVSVHSLRSRNDRTESLVAERGLSSLTLTYHEARTVRDALALTARRPEVLRELMTLIGRTCGSRPAHLAKSLALVPRVLQVYAEIERARPDVVHLFWGHYPSLVGHLVRRFLPDVTLSTFLGAYDLEERYGPSTEVTGTADVVWTHAQANVPAIEALGVRADRLEVAYRGTDVRRFDSARAAGTRAKTQGRILAAGRLVKDKAMGDVLEAFARASQRHPDASLTLLGDGPERAALERAADRLGIAERVRFLGHVPHERVFEEMAKAEVFVLLSRSEGERLPNVVKEAMLSECAVVTTDTAGIRELVPDDDRGIVVPQGDTAAAAAALERFLAQPAERERVGRSAAEFVREHFSIETTMRRYLERWRTLVNDGERSPAAAAAGRPGTGSRRGHEREAVS